ncbi:hypothetical protein ACV3O0_15255 [Clostridium perfringens]
MKGGNTFKNGKKLSKSQNIIEIVLKKVLDIRLNHIHQITNTIVKVKSCRFIVEDLNIK